MADYSIKGSLRTDKGIKKNGKYSIGLRVNVHGKETKVSTKLEVEKKDWDYSLQRPYPKAVLSEFLKLVDALDDHLYSEGRLGEEISLQSVKDFYAGKKRIKTEHQSFYEYFENFYQGKKYKPNTIKVYKGTLTVLKEFKPQLRIVDINLRFAEDFDIFLTEIKLNIDGGRFNRHKNLRTVIKDIANHRINIDNPYDRFKIPKSGVKDIYLEQEELDLIYQLQPKFTRDSTGRTILYMYLLASYTGFRFSDIIDLKWNHIDHDKKQIIKQMQKTGGDVILHIYPKAWRLLLVIASAIGKQGGKNNLGTDEYVFEKRFSNPTVNKYLKTFAEMAGITKLLTFHTARHTFATLLVLGGEDIFTVSKLLGHSDISVTQRYVNATKKLIENHAKNTKMFQ